MGVSDSNRDRGIGPNNRAVVWLVSGLDPAATPAGQISGPQPFKNPVVMFGDKTIDTASNPELRNDRKVPLGGGILPGIYDLSILENMAGPCRQACRGPLRQRRQQNPRQAHQRQNRTPPLRKTPLNNNISTQISFPQFV